MKLKYLITGTGRCGTLFAAKYAQALGLDIQHEEYGRDGTSNWYLAVPWELQPVPIFEKTLHVYREPLATISSLTTCGLDHPFWEAIIRNTPVYENDPVLIRAMKHWLYWNCLCEAVADCSIAIESWNSDFVFQFFEVEDTHPDIPTNTHTWKGAFKEHSWQDLHCMDPDLTYLIRRKARAYGYSYPYEAHLDSH